MSKRILVIDASTAGISGDMFVSAAVDLGADEKGTLEAMLSVKNHVNGCKNLEIGFHDVLRNGFRAKHLKMRIEERDAERQGIVLMDSLRDSLSGLHISARAREFGMRALKMLIDSEASLHGETASEVHLHEAGSIDTLLDILGCCYAFDDLKVFDDVDCYSTPVAVGGGELSFSHGKLRNPSPAVLEIAKRARLKIIGGPVSYEIATPTGMAILSSLSTKSVEYYPVLSPEAVGIGAGTREIEGVPNILRMIIGDSPSMKSEEIIVLETNLDDITGEEMAYAMELIMEQGAKDVSAIATIAKKGRPGFLLRVIADGSMVEKLSDLIMRETGSLGVRILNTTRHVATREIIPIKVRIGNDLESVSLKIARSSSGEIIGMKPEHEEVKRLARKYGRPLRTLVGEISAQARKELLSPG